MKRLILIVALVAAAGCATVDKFNKVASDLTHEAIVASENNQCTVHAAPCLSANEFREVNVELNKLSVAGREFTKLRLAGKASTADIVTFLGVVAEENAILSKTYKTGGIAKVLQALTKLQTKAAGLLGQQ